MRISIKTPDMTAPILYELHGKSTLEELKLLIQCDLEIEPREQRLVHSGKVLREPEFQVGAGGWLGVEAAWIMEGANRA